MSYIICICFTLIMYHLGATWHKCIYLGHLTLLHMSLVRKLDCLFSNWAQWNKNVFKKYIVGIHSIGLALFLTMGIKGCCWSTIAGCLVGWGSRNFFLFLPMSKRLSKNLGGRKPLNITSWILVRKIMISKILKYLIR